MISQKKCPVNLNSNPVVYSIYQTSKVKLLTLAEKIELAIGNLQEEQLVGCYSGGSRINIIEIINCLNQIKIIQPIVDNEFPIDAKYAYNFALKTPKPPVGQGVVLLGDCGCKSKVTLDQILDLPFGSTIPQEFLDFLCCLAQLLRQISDFISTFYTC